MDIKLQIIIVFSFLYVFMEIFMSMRQKRNRSIVKSGDKLSLWILMISISIGYWLSFSFSRSEFGRIYHWDTFFAVGTSFIIIGLIIRINSILTLKQHFTYTVTQIENHKLIETGFYKSIRHPGYLGQLIIFLGISTALSNWMSIVLMIIPIIIGFSYRIKIEEEFMIEQIGEKYKDYQTRTKRLIPMIY